MAVPDVPPPVLDVWGPAFPSADLVGVAAGRFASLPPWRGEEGPRWRITVSPGTVAVGSRDLGKAERAHERAESAREAEVEVIAAWIAEHGEPPDEGPGREITCWSRKSRSRMFRSYCELDYGPLAARPGVPAMVTLTYPGRWEVVAPDGKTVKKHLKAFRKRWERAWGERVLALWKLEFQRRGAPHVHLFTVTPVGLSPDGEQFKGWLSRTWAEVVGCPDPEEYRRHQAAGTGVDYAEGLRSRDPRRIAVYFSKHGTFAAKDYQNEVPSLWQEPGKGPGRFWGYWGLKRAAVAVEVTPGDAIMAARVMRRWAAAQDVTHVVTVERVTGGAAVSAYPEVVGLAGAQLAGSRRVRRRRVRRRAVRLPRSRGWVSVNDGPRFAMDVARYLGMVREGPG